MPINAKGLAKAIVLWLEFEALCRRSLMLSEALLTVPVGLYLQSALKSNVLSEQPYKPFVQMPAVEPAKTERRPKQMDFAVKRRGGEHELLDAIESKFVAGKRDFKQEVFDDLFRLWSIGKPGVGRWLVLAGTRGKMEEKLLQAEGNIGNGGGRFVVFKKVLPTKLDQWVKVPVAKDPQLDSYWIDSAIEMNVSSYPKSMKLCLRADEGEVSEDAWRCMVWQVSRSQKSIPLTINIAQNNAPQAVV